MISKIHHSDAEKLQHDSTDRTVSAVFDNSKKLEQVTQAVKDLHETAKDHKETKDGFNMLASAAQATMDTVDSLKEDINNPEKVVRKLEEVKSASLITNKLLKEINAGVAAGIALQMPDVVFPEKIGFELKGVETVTLKGNRGEIGPVGPQGTPGRDGVDGVGKDGSNGKNGADGRNGTDGIGKDGKDGADGSPDKPDEIVVKINVAKNKIEPKQIKGLLQLIEDIDSITKYPVGAGGGHQPLKITTSGSSVADYLTTLNFTGAGVSTSYSNGVVTITISGGSGSRADDEVPTGTINGSNVTFTLANTPVAGTVHLYQNGVRMQAGASKDYTISGATITMVTAPITDSILLADYEYL